MAVHTGVDWSEAGWPVVVGCTKHDAACANCYAVNDVWRMAHNPNPKVYQPMQGLVGRHRNGRLNWTGDVHCLTERLDWPMKWKQPRRVFVSPLGDLFHPEVPDEFIKQVFWMMGHQATWHQYQVLTKWPERAQTLLNQMYGMNDPYPNVWLITSAGTQETLDKNLAELVQTPAAVHGVSAEPLLEPLDFTNWFDSYHMLSWWVVLGGESGKHARPAQKNWFTDIIEQCQRAQVPVFVKQLGKHLSHELGAKRKGSHPEEWPLELQVRDYPLNMRT